MSAGDDSQPGWRLARRVDDLGDSIIFEISARAAELADQGVDMVRLDAGEPDFDTPEWIIEAGINALEDGYTTYTASGGLPELKAAIRKKLARDNNLHYADNEVMHSCGAKQALFNACMTLLRPGDEMVIPGPHWGTYKSLAKLTGAQLVDAPSYQEDGFVLTPETLEACLNDNSRVVVLNTPNNPTGQVYSRAALSALANVLLDYPNIVVLSDDIYEHLRFDDAPYADILNVCPSLKHRTLVINGVSKAYAMTGWRVGLAAGPAELIAEMTKLQGQTTSHTAAVSQKAAAAALSGGLNDVRAMAQAFAARARRVADGLAGIEVIECVPAQGSFYCLPDFSRVIASLDGVDDDTALGHWLLDELGIAMVPGSAFGAPGHMRLSFAADEDTIDKGLERLRNAFA